MNYYMGWSANRALMVFDWEAKEDAADPGCESAAGEAGE